MGKWPKIRLGGLFLLGFGILLSFHLFSFTGMKGFDGIEYAYHANRVLEGALDLSDHHFAYRWAVIYPAALFYAWMGIGDFSSALPAVFASLIILALLIQVLRAASPAQQIAGVLMLVLSPLMLYYWDKLMPDIQVALGVFLAFWARGKFEWDKKPGWGILMSAGLMWAFLAKMTIILLILVLIFQLVRDLRAGQAGRFWGFALISGFLLLGLYLWVIYEQSGHPFARFQRILAKGYLNTCSYDQLEVKYLIKRISYELVYTWARNGNFILFLPLLPAYFGQRKELSQQQKYWLYLGLIAFLSANFMSISPTSYVPMCADERHFLFIIPIWALGSGLVLENVLKDKWSSLGMGLLAGLLMIWTKGMVSFAYGLILFASLLPLLKHHFRQYLTFSLILFLSSLMLVPVEYGHYLRGLNYRAQKNALLQWAEGQDELSLVVTNAVQERIGNYYFGFDSTHNIQFREFENIERELVDKDPKCFLLVNAYARFMSGMEWKDLPAYAREIPQVFDPVYKEDPSEMYALPDISWVSMPDPFWEDSMIHAIIDDQRIVEGHPLRISPKTYAEGWDIALSEWDHDSSRLWIRGRMLIMNEDQGQANWQVHLNDKEGKNIDWKSAALQHRTPVPGKWVHLQIDHLIEVGQHGEGSLKLRFWNEGPAHFKIAALRISIARLTSTKGQP